MTRDARRVGRLRLRAPSRPLVAEGQSRIARALAEATLPTDGLPGLVVMRTVALSRLSLSSSPLTLRRAVERAVGEQLAVAVTIDSSQAATANAVRMRDRCEACIELVRQVCSRPAEATRAWYWHRLFPGLSATAGAPAAIELSLVELAQLTSPPWRRSVVALAETLVEAGCFPEFARLLTPEAGRVLLTSLSSGHPPLRLAPSWSTSSTAEALESPVLDVSSWLAKSRSPVARAVSSAAARHANVWGERDPRTRWACCVAVEAAIRRADARSAQSVSSTAEALARELVGGRSAPRRLRRTPPGASEPTPDPSEMPALRAEAKRATSGPEPDAGHGRDARAPEPAPAESTAGAGARPPRAEHARPAFKPPDGAPTELGVATNDARPATGEAHPSSGPRGPARAGNRPGGEACEPPSPSGEPSQPRSPETMDRDRRREVGTAETRAPLERSELCGLLFLVHVLRRLGFEEWLGERREDPGLVGKRTLLRLGESLELPATDPLRQLLQAGLDEAGDPPHGNAAWSGAVQEWLGGEGLSLPLVARRTGYVRTTKTHLDALLWLREVNVPVRRAALDLDPGYVSWLGRVVSFHYIDPDQLTPADVG